MHDPIWRTGEGLRIGDPTTRIPALYPDASWDYGVWYLTAPYGADRARLTAALPRRGRVLALEAWYAPEER